MISHNILYRYITIFRFNITRIINMKNYKLNYMDNRIVITNIKSAVDFIIYYTVIDSLLRCTK